MNTVSHSWASKIILLCSTLMLIAMISPVRLHAQVPEKLNPDAKLMLLDGQPPGKTARIFSPSRFSPPFTHYGLVFSPNGEEVFYTVMVKDAAGKYRGFILELEWRDGKWSEPGIAPFSGIHSDHTPNISADGRKIIFLSSRPVKTSREAGRYNFFCVERENSSWGEPYYLGDDLNSRKAIYPYLARNGDLYFGSYVSAGDTIPHIYISKFVNGKYRKPERLRGEINTPFGEYNPVLSTDGSLLFIEIIDAPGGFGGGDIHVSRKQRDGTWGKPTNLGRTFNSENDDVRPLISPGRTFVVFMSDRKPNFGSGGALTFNDILWSTMSPAEEYWHYYWIKEDTLKLRSD